MARSGGIASSDEPLSRGLHRCNTGRGGARRSGRAPGLASPPGRSARHQVIHRSVFGVRAGATGRSVQGLAVREGRARTPARRGGVGRGRRRNVSSPRFACSFGPPSRPARRAASLRRRSHSYRRGVHENIGPLRRVRAMPVTSPGGARSAARSRTRKAHRRRTRPTPQLLAAPPLSGGSASRAPRAWLPITRLPDGRQEITPRTRRKLRTNRKRGVIEE